MIFLPTPPTTDDPALNDWLYKLFQQVKSLQPRQSRGVVTQHTIHGVTREAKPPEPSRGGNDGPYWLP
jgi:hypothetical protein